jgi:MFS family permease
LFAGADHAAGVELIASWFRPKDRGTPMGVFMTATSLGLVIAYAIVPSLIQASGWRLSYHVFGAASIVVGLPCLLLPRNGPEARAQPHTAVRRDKQARRLPKLKVDHTWSGGSAFGARSSVHGCVHELQSIAAVEVSIRASRVRKSPSRLLLPGELADCKSVGLRLRRFESFTCHQGANGP